MAKVVIDVDKLAAHGAKLLDRVVDIPFTPDAAEEPLIKQGLSLILVGIARAAQSIDGDFITLES